MKAANQSISEQTISNYLARARSLMASFSKKAKNRNFTATELVDALLAEHKNNSYTKSTWRQYKAAVIYWLTTTSDENYFDIEKLQNTTSNNLPKRSHKTSSRRQKSVPESAYDTISKTLFERQSRRPQSAALLAILKATLLTGLRPKEWGYSEVKTCEKSGRPLLRIKNSKHTNGRANGEFREMYIDKLDPEEILTIKTAINTFKNCHTEAQKKSMSSIIAKEFAYAKKQILNESGVPHNIKKTIRLIRIYSFRHQFVADAKMSLAGDPSGPVILAALLGHNSVDTAPGHYGKRRCGQGKIKVMPTPESIDAVARKTPKCNLAKSNAVNSNPSPDPSPGLFP